ncbi:MAG: DNA alkylation repair protein [Chitinophagales bacterium]|nr:DNA alkylation repair protein [Chitinophagales bacterium]
MASFNTNLYIKQLRAAFALLADKQIAKEQSAYMKNLFPFFGIKTPERNAIVKGFIKEHGLPPFDKLDEVLKACYKQKEREFHYAAIHLASKFVKQNPKEMVPLLEFLITNNSWWDSVDSITGNCTLLLFELNPQMLNKLTWKWVKSNNMWLQRSAIISQLLFKHKTNEAVLFRNIKALNGGNEFFINKAIGWALREYSKTNPQQVREFIASNKLSPLSVREGSKYL